MVVPEQDAGHHRCLTQVWARELSEHSVSGGWDVASTTYLSVLDRQHSGTSGIQVRAERTERGLLNLTQQSISCWMNSVARITSRSLIPKRCLPALDACRTALRLAFG